jgi:glyoxalase family protein
MQDDLNGEGMQLTGLHHVSALTAQAQRNVEFYTRVLGLRLVKKTVNQDNTSSYHLFYGDEVGNPGTELTFFDIPRAAANLPGVGSISRIALRVTGQGALEYWQDRLTAHGVEHSPMMTVGGRTALAFQDFEGQHLLLSDDTGAAVAGGNPWANSPVPVVQGIRGLDAVMLTVLDPAPTARVLTDVLGFRPAGHYPDPDAPQRQIHIFTTGAGGPGAEVHVETRTDLPLERLGRGGVHHVAFRVPDEEAHEAWFDRVESAGLRTSGQIDRYYFKSIYFREPNGILFELATDGPGFATDEDVAHLGERLALPPFLEPRRASIEAALQPLNTTPLISGSP